VKDFLKVDILYLSLSSKAHLPNPPVTILAPNVGGAREHFDLLYVAFPCVALVHHSQAISTDFSLGVQQHHLVKTNQSLSISTLQWSRQLSIRSVVKRTLQVT
jgi:hypothetical protein